jgi:hypothetical protein
MKLTFFLIGFTLIFLRVYLGWSGQLKSGPKTVTITVSDGTDYTQLKYRGKIALNDEETAFQAISPGGYVKFRKNEKKVMAEADLKGEIHYELSDGGSSFPDDEKAKQFIAAAIREMIAYGFDAEPRMERVFRRGGTRALLNELKILQSRPVGTMYARRLIQTDTLSAIELTEVIDNISAFTADHEKAALLNKVSVLKLSDSIIVDHYFTAIGTMRADVDKANVMNHIISGDTLTSLLITRIQATAAQFTADIDKQRIFQKLTAHKDYPKTVQPIK